MRRTPRTSVEADFMRNASPLGKCTSRLDIPIPEPLLADIRQLGKPAHTDWSREVLEKTVAGLRAIEQRPPSGECTQMIEIPADSALMDDITTVARMRGARDPRVWLKAEIEKLVAGELVVMQRRLNGTKT
jgi:hypothetical protein